MTLSIVARAVDGLVLASDSRVTGGEGAIADTSEKFFQVSRDLGGMTYGLAAPGYEGLTSLVEDVKRNRELSNFEAIVRHAKGKFAAVWEKHKGQEIPQAQGVAFVLAGYDDVFTNGFRIFNFSSPHFEPNEIRVPFFLAGQWHVAEYVLHRVYYPEVTVSVLAEMVVFAMQETMTVHETVGGPLNLATVDRSQGFQRLHEQAIREIVGRNQGRFVRWRSFLYDIIEEFSDEEVSEHER